MGSLPILGRQLGLYEAECESCVAFPLCGGTESAPCGCVWNEPSLRHRCEGCSVICRERRSTGGSKASLGFAKELAAAGTTLDVVRITRVAPRALPPFIPLRTEELHDTVRLDLPWIGVGIKYLLTRHRSKGVALRPWLRSRRSVQAALRVRAATKLVAVFNGRDDTLEAFWSANRPAIARRLVEAGFGIATGPTYSLYNEAPASHHVCMLLRHHRCVMDLQQGGLAVAPNLYWRNELDVERWAAWAADQPRLRVIARDFSRTKQPATFAHELRGLLGAIRRSGRSLHVVATGVGIRGAGAFFRSLREIECTGSIVTTGPVLEAIKHGHELQVTGQEARFAARPDVPRRELAVRNIEAASAFLRGLAAAPLAV